MTTHGSCTIVVARTIRRVHAVSACTIGLPLLLSSKHALKSNDFLLSNASPPRVNTSRISILVLSFSNTIQGQAGDRRPRAETAKNFCAHWTDSTGHFLLDHASSFVLPPFPPPSRSLPRQFHRRPLHRQPQLHHFPSRHRLAHPLRGSGLHLPLRPPLHLAATTQEVEWQPGEF